MNHIVVMGRLTRDPERRETPAGKAVTSFSVAVDRPFASKDGEKKSDFFRVVVWDRQADFVSKYFVKGQWITIAGRVEINEWTDKENNKRTSVEIVANNVYFTGDRKDRDTSAGFTNPREDFSTGYSSPVESSDFAELDVDDGDLPF